MKKNASGQLVLSWPRFFSVLAPIIVMGLLGIVFSLRQDGWHGPSLSLIIFLVSMIFFMSYRFRKLRESLGVVSKIPEDPQLLYRQFVGPPLLMATWFIGTSVLAVAAIIVPALV